MPQLLYALQVTGKATPMNTTGTILNAHTIAPSCTLTTVTGAEGVRSTLQPAPGGEATFESEVMFTGETSFQEAGTTTFGDPRHRLYFSTVGQGYLGPGAEPQGYHGAVVWGGSRGGAIGGSDRLDYLELSGQPIRGGDGYPLQGAVRPRAAGLVGCRARKRYLRLRARGPDHRLPPRLYGPGD
jgi:hypothetical protein